MKKIKIVTLLLATALNYLVAYGQWNLTGNAGTNPPTNFLGTTDQKPLVFKVNNLFSGLIDYDVSKANTALGHQSLTALSTGIHNSALGYATLYANTSGGANTAVGTYALTSSQRSWNNSAFGAYALAASLGDENTAVGASSLTSNTSGSQNSAIGFRSLYSNTIGYQNAAIGYHALYFNTSGYLNMASGYKSLYSNTTGSWNVANGSESLRSNISGGDNTALGNNTLYSNTSGSSNTAVGSGSLFINTTAGNNTGLGVNTGPTNTFISESTAMGAGALVNLTSKIRLGSTTTLTVETQSSFTTVSDGRFKNNISETDVKGLEFINKLRPVVYNFDTRKFQEFLLQNTPEEKRKEYLNKDFGASTGKRQSGFVAQEVAKAAQEVGYDFSGVHVPEAADDNYSLAYSEFVVPLVKAVNELSAQNDKNEKIIKELNTKIDELQSQVAAILQKQSQDDKSTTQNEQVSGNVKESYLEQNSPNPFNSETKIRYHLNSNASNSKVTVTNINGQVLKVYPLQGKLNGEITINSMELAPGIYFYSLVVNENKIDTRKMVITR